MAFPSTPVIDDCNRPDEALSANPALWADDWFGFGVFPGLRVISNRCGNSDSGYATSDWIADTFTDIEVYATLPTGITGEIGLVSRIQNRGTASMHGYAVVFQSSGNVNLDRWVNQVQTNITSTTQAVSAGDSIGLEIIGDELTVWHKPAAGAWTSILTATDATIAGAGGIGFVLFGTVTTLDDLGGGEVIPDTVELASAIDFSFTTQAELTATKLLSVNVATAFTVQAGLTVTKLLSSNVAAAFTVQAGLTATKLLSVNVATAFTMQAELTVTKLLSANVGTAFTVQAILRVPALLSSDILSAFTIQASLNVINAGFFPDPDTLILLPYRNLNIVFPERNLMIMLPERDRTIIL